ncbi:arginine--tRNA ligase [Myxococcota bacterium]|nr:arginine--tRNA ligase [Myxococcota bacterium]
MSPQNVPPQNAPSLITQLVREAALAAGYTADELEPAAPTRDAAHGDYQSNSAFRIAKANKLNPRAVAQAIVERLPAHEAVRAVSIAGPGFINFTLNDAWLGAQLVAQCEDTKLGLAQRQGRVVIDYSSPNVAKRMHVGHLRSTVIGAALHQLYRFAGYEVIADNHIGDWGTQFGKLIVAWRGWLDAAAYEADPIGELQRIYADFEVRAEADPSLADQARHETALLQAGDPDNRALWRQFIEVSLQEFNELYTRLGIQFDEVLGESAYNDMLQPMVDSLLASGIAQLSDGAVVIPFVDADGPGLAKAPMLIRKRDGAALYGTTDLATARYRLDRWSPSRIIYVTDTRQQFHFQQLFAACRKLGWTQAELVHCWFGLLSLPDGTMSSRKGNVITLKDLLDEAARHARALVDEKSPNLSDDERAKIAEAVGVASVRYADLSQNPQSDVTFRWEKMLTLDGNTAPFLMYSYARCRSLQAKGGITDWALTPFTPVEPVERELTVALTRLNEVIVSAMDGSRPNTLCDYLFNVAGLINRYYHDLPVLTAAPEDRARRLNVIEASARVLGQGLKLLGIQPLDRM